MQFRIGKPWDRRLWLVLAFLACFMQVLACALPSLVVCHKADRPPRLEFFSDSCSCRVEEIHSCTDQNEHGTPCLGEACTDIHLKSHSLVAARSHGPRVSLTGEQRASEPERHASGFASACARFRKSLPCPRRHPRRRFPFPAQFPICAAERIFPSFLFNPNFEVKQ